MLEITVERKIDRAAWICEQLILTQSCDKRDLRRGIDRLILDIENIEIDAPKCYEEVAIFLIWLHKSNCICNKYISTIPKEVYERFMEVEEFWSYFKELNVLYTSI